MEYRKVEVLINNKWTAIPFLKIKEGDIFRMFEATGEQVMYGVHGVFIAECDAYTDKSTGLDMVRDRPFGKSK